jgi:hypothetical protein
MVDMRDDRDVPQVVAGRELAGAALAWRGGLLYGHA